MLREKNQVLANKRPTPWSRRIGPASAILLGPLLLAKIYVVTQASSTPIVWLKSYLVHTQALPTGDYVTPSAIAMAYALAAPLQLAWTMNIIQTRTKSIRAGFFPWIIVAMYSVAMARAAYIPTDDPQKAIESYSTNSQIVMSSDVIFSLLFCSANIGSSAVLIVALRQLSTPFRRTRRSRRKEK